MKRNNGGFVALAIAALVILTIPPASANNWGQGGGDVEKSPSKDGDFIISEVKVSGTEQGSAPLASRETDWKPPACWLEPLYTPDEYAEHRESLLIHPESAETIVQEELEEADYHRGEDGLWWGRVYNSHLDEDDARRECDLAVSTSPLWVETGDTPQETGISPEMLAEIAYAATQLPSPDLELSPPPELQKVNLETYVSAGPDIMPERVTTTASIDYAGIQFAATTVAVPTELHIEAGTEHANPTACAYPLTGSALDTANEPCNITYRKSSGDGTYSMEAQLTWEVYWTASADPDGPPQQPELPDGSSTADHQVTVKEVQTIVR